MAVELTTSQRYESLFRSFPDKCREASATAELFAAKHNTLTTRHRAFECGQIMVSSEQLQQEKATCLRLFQDLCAKRDDTILFQQELQKGLDHLERGPFDAKTIEWIRRDDPEIHKKVQANNEICIRHFAEIKRWHGEISSLCESIQRTSREFESSLKAFVQFEYLDEEPLVIQMSEVSDVNVSVVPPKPSSSSAPLCDCSNEHSVLGSKVSGSAPVPAAGPALSARPPGAAAPPSGRGRGAVGPNGRGTGTIA